MQSHEDQNMYLLYVSRSSHLTQHIDSFLIFKNEFFLKNEMLDQRRLWLDFQIL